MPLGDILLQKEQVTSQQIQDALQHQKRFPGKLGTQLVELGFVPLEALERVLSEHTFCPSVNDQALEDIDHYCRLQFPVEALEYFQVLPFRRQADCLCVAMVNPKDETALRWLNESAGCGLRVFCISEIRFHYFLYRHYQRDLIPRIRNLYFRYYKEKCRTQLISEGHDKARAKLPAVFETDHASLEALGLKPLAEGELLSAADIVWEEEVIYMQPPPPPPPLPEPVPEYEPEFADLSKF